MGLNFFQKQQLLISYHFLLPLIISNSFQNVLESLSTTLVCPYGGKFWLGIQLNCFGWIHDPLKEYCTSASLTEQFIERLMFVVE